jgi:serine/threonine protein kinase/tetratricopeptide (TPR) repeat protein
MSDALPHLMTIFTAAFDLPPGPERAAYLDVACGGDAALRAEVEALLAVSARAGGFLEGAVKDAGRTVDRPPAAEVPGMVVGPYKLVEQIGEGGMGSVWMAQQTEPVKRSVAVKLIKPGMDSRQVLARFEAERQALAIMDHPNIARVLDAGTTDAGRPYFVMDLVRGVPITTYCDEHHLTPRERLNLFVPVCQAVQHAHQKGVIHRDLKPSNVLVALYDDRPIPKVIDFGVAKAAGQPLTEQTLHTGFGAVVGTVEYMSPEQATLDQLDVDTRSDVYSLGVVLYELLAGSPPFSKREREAAGVLEMLRRVREQELSKPSAKLSTAEELPSLAANRGMEPAKLTRLVRGELDWIVMKALEKDRSRRYESANAFAVDVQRYLADEAVQACPPSAGYRLRKFVRRNKGPTLATGVVSMAVAIGMIGVVWGLIEARTAVAAEKTAKETAETREAETRAVLDFVETRILGAARPPGDQTGLGGDVTLRGAIDVALTTMERSFADRPLIEARLRQTVGVAFGRVGDHQAAETQFLRARELFAAELGPTHRDTLRSARLLAGCYAHLGQYADALRLDEETLDQMKVALGPDDPETLRCMMGLANSYEAFSRHTEAHELCERTLVLMTSKLGLDDYDTLICMNNLANSYHHLGRHPEALQLRERTLAAMKAALGPGHPDTLMAMDNLASSYAALDRRTEALELSKETVALKSARLGPDHPETLFSMNNLAVEYAADGHHDDALKLRQQVLAARMNRLSPNHPDTLKTMWGVASSLLKLNRGEEAVLVIDECLCRAACQVVEPKMVRGLLILRWGHFEGKKDSAGCRATADMWDQRGFNDPSGVYNSACMRAVISSFIRATDKGPAGVRQADTEADQAMDRLRKAVSVGYRDVEHMKRDTDLDALRQRQDFQKLVTDLESAKKEGN